MPNLLERAKNHLFRRQRSYQLTFSHEVAKDVLADLATFCRANASTFHSDPAVARQLDGRREVWLRIQKHLNLSSQQLWEIYERKIDG